MIWNDPFFQTLLGGALAFGGGWLQSEKALRVQRKERLQEIYLPVTSAMIKVRIAVELLTDQARRYTHTEMPEYILALEKARLQEADEECEKLNWVIDWLLLDGTQQSKQTVNALMNLQTRFSDFSQTVQTFWETSDEAGWHTLDAARVYIIDVTNRLRDAVSIQFDEINQPFFSLLGRWISRRLSRLTNGN